jgi:peptide/nickel transport system substrate-binding protein
MRRIAHWLSCFIILSILLAACAAPAAQTGGAASGGATNQAAAGTPKAGGTLTVGLNGEIDTIDPHKSVTIVGFQVYTQIFEGLVQLNAKLDGVEPLLAESWDQPDDTTYVFHLRKGVKFHNGADFTAKDVKFTFDRVMDEKTGSSRKPDFTPVKAVDIVDDFTVKFTLSAPYGPFLSKLESLRILPNDPAMDITKTPIGTGPFSFVEWISGQKITLKKNPNYWMQGLPYLDEVVFQPIPEPSTRVVNLQTGSVDLLNEVPFKDVKTLEGDANLKIYRIMGVVRDHVGFNMSKPPFKDNPNLRKAIAWAVDRKTIADSIMFGLAQPAQVAIPSSNWGYDAKTENAFGFDLDKAKEFYAKADPKPTEITVKVSPTYPDEVKMAELMQQDLAKIGINLKIEQLEWSNWIQQVVTDGNYEMEIVLISGGSDPDDFFYQWHHSGEVFNIWRYTDPDMDKMLEEARATVDQGKRKEIYAKIQEKLIEDAPLAHIIYRESVMGASAALKDFVMTGRYDMDFRKVWLDR